MKADRWFALTRWWEQRGFGLPVLFGLFRLEKGAEARLLFGPILPADRSQNNSFICFSAVTPLKLRALRKYQEPERGPAVQIPSAPTNEALRNGGPLCV